MPRLIGKPVHRRGLGFGAHALGVIVGPANVQSVPAVVDVQWRTGELTSCRREALELIPTKTTTTKRIEQMPPTKTSATKAPAKGSKKAPAKASTKAPTKAQRDRYLLKAEEVVKARIAEMKREDPTLTEQTIANALGCSKGTFRNTVYVSTSPVAPKPNRMREISEFLGWEPDALQLLQEKGILPELVEYDDVTDVPAPEPAPARKAAPKARKPVTVIPAEEAFAPPAPPTPIVKPGTLRQDITTLQEENRPRDQAIHALQREVAELRAVLAEICDGLGVDGPKVRQSRKTA
jgi:hypothetical protein